MSNVVKLHTHKIKKRDRESPEINKIQTSKLITDGEIFQNVFEEVVGEWQSFAIKNRLNEYISSKLPSKAKMGDSADYLNDLNIISAIEQKLEMKIVMLYPGATLSNPNGWLVSFSIGKNVYSTSPDMSSESSARAMAILLFLKFHRTLDSLGRSLS